MTIHRRAAVSCAARTPCRVPTDPAMRRRDQDIDESEAPSKTQIKEEMHALQDLGAALLELPDDWLDTLELPERLRDALREFRRIPTMNAQKRQLGFIGKLMRTVDPEPLQRAVDTHRHSRAREAQSLKEIERWRDRLLSEDDALTAWCTAYPGGDLRALRQLIGKARQEEAEARDAAPHAGAPQRKGRYYRELYQLLAARLKDASAAAH